MFKLIIVIFALAAVSHTKAGIIGTQLGLAGIAPAGIATQQYAAIAAPVAISSQSGIIRGIPNTRIIAQPIALSAPGYAGIAAGNIISNGIAGVHGQQLIQLGK